MLSLGPTPMTVDATAVRRYLRPVVFVLLAITVFFVSANKWNHGATSGSASPPVTYPREIARITFAAAGDVIPHQAVTQSAAVQNQLAAQAAAAPSQSDTDKAVSSGTHGGWDILFSQ